MRSYVVTGGGRGVGRAVAERLLSDPDTALVVALELDPPGWTADRLAVVTGDAADPAVAGAAAEMAEAAAPLVGWVNNAAVFRDASLHEDGPAAVLDLITANLAPAVVGSAAALDRFLAAGTGGAIVNVSSHQAARPVPGCTPYATAKSAIEGLTRALAVDYGRRGVRVNTVSLGTVVTDRYGTFLAGHEPAVAGRIDRETTALHPLGRLGTPPEAAAVIAYLLSDGASFVTGATVPVDGGRSVLGNDPGP
jgi:NAD(P)-dependent dehydrogenase (short-subunit alcohol dehydrogenase family)